MEWFFDLLPTFVVLIVAIQALLYYYGTSTYDHWKVRGVASIRPTFPFLGTLYKTVFSIKAGHQMQQEIYNKFKGNDIAGIFTFRKPVLLVLKPEIIESILIKDFGSFYNRGNSFNEKVDPLSAHLFNLENTKWKHLRNKLSPTFTSGKLKGMHQQVVDCSTDLMAFMKSFEKESFDVREVMAKFTTDVISSCAFGLNSNALQDPNSPFRAFGKKTFEVSVLNRLRVGVRAAFPWLISLLKWKGIPIKMEQFFMNTIKDTVEYREKNNIERHDFLHLMNELRKHDINEMANGTINKEEKEYIFDEKLMAANAFVFFVAGFETTASTLSYALFEMAINPDVQEKAYQEVVDVYKRHNNTPTFEATKEMDYLGQVISETLRMFPPVSTLTRKVTKTYRVPGTNVVLPVGSMVHIPAYSIHHDAEHYPDPEKFKPERFTEENKEKMKKGTYMPFGDGPRICIGMRFAQVEMKVALSKILFNYKISMSKKTIWPFQYDTRTFFIIPKGGIWLDLKKRH